MPALSQNLSLNSLTHLPEVPAYLKPPEEKYLKYLLTYLPEVPAYLKYLERCAT